jgi:hypothetical protein
VCAQRQVQYLRTPASRRRRRRLLRQRDPVAERQCDAWSASSAKLSRAERSHAPWVLLRIRTCPCSAPSAFSIDKLASASSPAERLNHRRHKCGRGGGAPNRLLAYMLAERKPHSPPRAASGVRQDMLVEAMMCCKSVCPGQDCPRGIDTMGRTLPDIAVSMASAMRTTDVYAGARTRWTC